MLLIALAVFGASSAACSFAGSPGELIAARAALGLGAAVIFPMSIAVLPALFTPDEQPRAIAVVMGATFIAFPVGPLLGGWLLDNFWWGSVFLINVPVVVIALAAVAFLMPESHGPGPPGSTFPEDVVLQDDLDVLTLAVPEIRARALDEFARTIDVTAVLLARRSGQKPDDVAVRALAGAVFGVILATTLPVLERGEIDLDAIFASVDAGLAELEAGFAG